MDAPDDDPTGLPAAYRWSDSNEGATLCRRYGCVATVTATTVRVSAEPPYHKAISGPCASVAQGKRMVEHLLAVRNCWGEGDRLAFRWQLHRERAQRRMRFNPPPRDDDEDWEHP